MLRQVGIVLRVHGGAGNQRIGHVAERAFNGGFVGDYGFFLLNFAHFQLVAALPQSKMGSDRLPP